MGLEMKDAKLCVTLLACILLGDEVNNEKTTFLIRVSQQCLSLVGLVISFFKIGVISIAENKTLRYDCRSFGIMNQLLQIKNTRREEK